MILGGAILGAVLLLVLALCRISRLSDDASYGLMEKELHVKHLEDINDPK